MPHRVLTTVIALAALVTPTLAQDGCPLERATYAEGDNGYELRFHQPKEWEMYGMTESVFELVGGPQKGSPQQPAVLAPGQGPAGGFAAIGSVGGAGFVAGPLVDDVDRVDGLVTGSATRWRRLEPGVRER